MGSWRYFSNPNIPSTNSTINISNLYVKVVANSNVELIVKDNYAQEDKPDSLAVLAYSIEGKPIKVLNVLEESGCNSFTINLDEGNMYY